MNLERDVDADVGSGGRLGAGAEASAPPAPEGSLADRLNALLAWYEVRYGIRPSAHDIARAITANSGRISHTTVSALLKGNNDNPQLKTLIELADFFGVDPGYLITREASPTAGSTEDPGLPEERLRRLAQTNPKAASQVELLFAMKELGAIRMGTRALTPTDEGRRAMLRILRGIGELSADGQNAVAGVVEAIQGTQRTKSIERSAE